MVQKKDIIVKPWMHINLGFKRDYGYLRFLFDIKDWLAMDNGEPGELSIYVRRPCDPAGYLANGYIEGDYAIYEPSQIDSSFEGTGELQIFYTHPNSQISKKIHILESGCSLAPGMEPPDPWKPWVDEVKEARDDTIAATEHYPKIDPDTKHWLVWDVQSGEWVDTGVIAEGREGGQHPYVSLERMGDYLYRVTYKTMPEVSDGGDWVISGACSSYVQNGKLFRNLDWDYSELSSFHIVCPGFEGMSFLNGLTDKSLRDDLIAQLPYRLVDGKNDHGIMVSTHVLYNDWNALGHGDIPLTSLPYLALTRVKSMATIEDDLADVLENMYVPPAMAAMEYLIQVLVTDGTTTYVLMPSNAQDGTYAAIDISANPKLSNFLWVPDATVTRQQLQRRPTGVERWNMMPCLLEELRFTKAYEAPDRLSEFIGLRGTTKDSTDEELLDIYEDAHALYLERTRDGSTWQTMHSVVYGAGGIESLCVQENWKKDYANSGSEIDDSTVGLESTWSSRKISNELGEKQGTIEDLDDIRSGAERGSTALQSVPDTYRTASAQDEIDAGKLTEPSSGLAVGKYFRIASIGSDGHAVLEAVDAPTAPIQSIDAAGTALIPDASGNVSIPEALQDQVYGLFKTFSKSGIHFTSKGFGIEENTNNPEAFSPKYRVGQGKNWYCVVTSYNFDHAIKHAMTDVGTASGSTLGKPLIWTDTEKTGAWQRLSIIKYTMDSVAVAGASYYLGEQTAVTISMPTDALLGQQIIVIFSSGETACTLTCDLAGFDFTPKANKTNRITFELIHKADTTVTGDVNKWIVSTEESE